MRNGVTPNSAVSLPLVYKVIMAHAVSESSGSSDEIFMFGGFGALIVGLLVFTLVKGKKDKKK